MKTNRNKISKGWMFSVLAVSFFLALPWAFSKAATTTDQTELGLSGEERLFIEKINDYRKDNGLKALKVSISLSEASEMMAKDMKANPSLINHDHKDSAGRYPADRAKLFDYTDSVGENLAAGYKTAEKVFEAWKNSTEHRNNMLSSDYEVLGIDRKVSDTDYKWYWVSMFGTESKKSDLVTDERYYSPFRTLRVSVTDSLGKRIPGAKIYITNRGGSKIASANASTMGRKTFKVEKRDEYYVKAGTAGYTFYTKRVKPGSKDSLSVKVWLEKE